MFCYNKKCANFSIKCGMGFWVGWFFSIVLIIHCPPLCLEWGNSVSKKVCLRTVPYYFGKYKLMFYGKIKAWVTPYSCGRQLLGVPRGDELLKCL